ncbi:MAG: TIGR03790 family protein [Planctomycetales bacterium]|nr:TIGR03790 family protein [Planctomycetales bacterium]
MTIRQQIQRIVLLLFGATIAAPQVFAGGGPENVFLVVNSLDEDSRTIANHYCALRQIPASNVFETTWDGSPNVITIKQFRTKLIADILKEIEARRLTKQIDYIVYSSGFPYSVDFLLDFPDKKVPSHRGRSASLTGMTYLHEIVRQKDKRYANFQADVNHYFADTRRRSTGFSSQYAYGRTGRMTPTRGSRYYLSTMLGYTAGAGNTVDEVINYLNISASADGTSPRGTIYLMQNPDARAIPRVPFFGEVVEQLQRAGVRAEIIAGDAKPIGVLPIQKRDVAGAVVGYAKFDWASSGSRILPGAICEHLTSYGAVLYGTRSQTLLCEFLRHGAAGASGTVVEPLSIWQKFPHPNIHVRYAHGCTLGESFYQAVANPYQLLIVGDPLCRPWAKIPTIRVEGIQPDQRLKGTVAFKPSCWVTVPVSRYRLFVDGRLSAECKAGESLSMDTTKLPNGYHELRIVGIDRTPIETQGRLILPVYFDNVERKISSRASPSRQVKYGSRFHVEVNAPGAKEILVYHRRRALASAQRSRARVMIDTRDIGSGPVELTIIAKGTDKGATNAWFAKPLSLDIIPTPRIVTPRVPPIGNP